MGRKTLIHYFKTKNVERRLIFYEKSHQWKDVQHRNNGAGCRMGQQTIYRSQSVLNLDEFTKIVIHCVLYIKSGCILADVKTPAQKWLDSDVSLLNDCSFKSCFLSPHQSQYSGLSQPGAMC